MRLITVNTSGILPMLDTGRSNFAMWVCAPIGDMPKQIQAFPKSHETFTVKFIYPGDQSKSKNVKVSDSVVASVTTGDGRICGFDVPVRSFYADLPDILMWLKDQQQNLNSESLRLNYRAVYYLLMQHREELFLPPQ